MLGNLGNIKDILQTAQKLQTEASRLREEVEHKEVEASAGGGMVKVRITGAMQVIAVEIDRTVVDPNDVEMLQDLVRAATNEALKKAKELLKEEMSKLTGGLSLPGVF